VKIITVKSKYLSELRFTELNGLFKNCLKNLLQIAGKRTNGVEHYSNRRLPLESLFKLARPVIELLPYIDSRRMGARDCYGRNNSLRLHGLAAPHLSRSAACLGTPCHEGRP
jgi:hypothetical protein